MVSTSDSYASLDRRLKNIHARTSDRVPGFCGYSSSQTASRLTQCVAEISVFKFTKSVADIFRSTGSFPADSVPINCGGLLINGDSSIRLEKNLYFRYLLKYVSNWIYAFAAILLSIRFSPSKRKTSLLYGVGIQDLQANGDDSRFLQYCRKCPVLPLSGADKLVVQAAKKIVSTDASRVLYGRDPLLSALDSSGLGLRTWIVTLVQHIGAAYSFLRALFSFPSLVLLGRDAAYHSIAVALNRDNVFQDVMLTTTNYFSQPLWTWALHRRRYRSHILWYSQNLYPITYVDEDISTSIPNLRYVNSDVQWVWSEGFKKFLSGICPDCDYVVVEPIIWHLPPKSVISTNNELVIALFDVTPVNIATERSMGLLRNYFTEEIASLFIKDVVFASQIVEQLYQVPIKVILKHKRGNTGIHSSRYIESIAKLVERGCIALVPSETNLYGLISTGSVVIAMPYSSPVYVAAYAGKAAFWYDPTSTLDWKLNQPEISLIQGSTELVAQLIRIFGLLPTRPGTESTLSRPVI